MLNGAFVSAFERHSLRATIDRWEEDDRYRGDDPFPTRRPYRPMHRPLDVERGAGAARSETSNRKGSFAISQHPEIAKANIERIGYRPLGMQRASSFVYDTGSAIQ
jgi:hypothetical protein